MNRLLPYEQSIATKLDELPLPDMADAIWADIAAQLDGDLPTDGENPAPGNNPPGGMSWAKGITLAVGAAGIALVAYWLTQVNQPAPTAMPANPLPVEQKTTQPDTAQAPQPVQGANTNTPEPPPTKTPTTSDAAVPDNMALPPISADSVRLQPTDPPAVKADSAAVPAQTPSLVLPPPGKKKKGTQGIKDGDYKFVQGKDST